MPLIDDIAVVPFSTKKALLPINVGSLRPSADVIEAAKDALVACGWNLSTAIPATATISYPFGFPFSLGGSGNCGCGTNWVTITTPTAVYRYCGYQPGQTPVGIGCFQFQYGSSGAASLANLCTVISATSPYNATLSTPGGTLTITLTSKLLGPYNNFDAVAGDGSFGVSDQNSSGGGYTLASVGSSPYTATLTGQFGIGVPVPQEVFFTFDLGPSGKTGVVQYALLASGISKYFIVANPYSFAVFDGINVRHSIAAFAPCIPVSEGFTAAYCAFVVGPGVLTNQLMWQGGPEGQPTSAALENVPITIADAARGPQVLALRSFGFPLLSLNGQPLLIAAYAMLSGHRDTDPAIVGKLWDCMVLSEQMAVGGPLSTGGRNFVCIASDSGNAGNSPSSLLFCIDDNGQPDAGSGGSGGSTGTGGSGNGGGSSPSNPTAPPGSGNGSFAGECSCTGSPNNHTVAWTAGDKFTSSMVGQTLTIPLPGLAHPWVSAGGSGDPTGTLPVIASVVSPTVLTTTQDLNSSFTSAAFTSP